MEQLLGTSPPVFLGLTCVVMGWAAFMTGQAVARTWRPMWQVFTYSALLACASRFLHFALFDGRLLSFTGFLADLVTLTLVGMAAYRMAHVAKMVSQYPWLYVRAGPWSYRDRHERPPATE